MFYPTEQTRSHVCQLENAIFGVKLEIRRTDNTDVKIADLDLVYPYIMFQWRIRTVDSETGASPTMRECNSESVNYTSCDLPTSLSRRQ